MLSLSDSDKDKVFTALPPSPVPVSPVSTPDPPETRDRPTKGESKKCGREGDNLLQTKEGATRVVED